MAMENIIQITPEAFTEICRTCLKRGELEPLQMHLHLFQNINIQDIIQLDLPQNICTLCLKFLRNVSNFIETFKDNDRLLRTILIQKEDVKVEDTDKDFTVEYNVTQDYKFEKESSDGKMAKKRIENCSCNICGKVFTRLGGLKRHLKIHTGIKPFKCKMCEKSFSEKCTLERHKLIHLGKKPFECTLCGRTCRRKDQIMDHILSQHPNVKEFNMVLLEHEVNNEDHTLPVKNEIVESSPKKVKTKERIETCLCNLCGKVFKRRGYLKNHMAIHAEVKPFRCDICGKTFTQRHVLTRHNLVHTLERPFQCSLCGKTFTRKEILTEHMKNHDGKRSHLCPHCGKYFTSQHYLAKHLRYYSTVGKKRKNPIDKCICPQCGKQLHSESYLKIHLLMHTGDKPYKCDICGQKFTAQYTLNNHINIHKGIKPYQCMQCFKKFRTRNSLKKHELLHTGERPFKCTSCDKGFIRRSHLKRHIRTH